MPIDILIRSPIAWLSRGRTVAIVAFFNLLPAVPRALYPQVCQFTVDTSLTAATTLPVDTGVDVLMHHNY
jgi:hypothetical protein